MSAGAACLLRSHLRMSSSWWLIVGEHKWRGSMRQGEEEMSRESRGLSLDLAQDHFRLSLWITGPAWIQKAESGQYYIPEEHEGLELWSWPSLEHTVCRGAAWKWTDGAFFQLIQKANNAHPHVCVCTHTPHTRAAQYAIRYVPVPFSGTEVIVFTAYFYTCKTNWRSLSVMETAWGWDSGLPSQSQVKSQVHQHRNTDFHTDAV